MEVATSDNEPIEKNRKRNRGSATVAEEEDAAPAHTPRRRPRSQPAESPEETTYFGPQNQTEHDDAPTAPSNDAGEAPARARISKHQRKAEKAEFQRKAQATIDLRARRQLGRMEREITASLQETQAPMNCRSIFSLHQPAARNPERSHQQQMDRAQDCSHYRNEWNAPLRASQVHQHPSRHADRAASHATARLPAPRTRARDSARCRNN